MADDEGRLPFASWGKNNPCLSTVPTPKLSHKIEENEDDLTSCRKK